MPNDDVGPPAKRLHVYVSRLSHTDMQIYFPSPGRAFDVAIPRLTLRTEPLLRKWYERLQEIARAHVIGQDMLANLYAAARKRGVDLSHIITPSGQVADTSGRVEELQWLLLDAIADDPELVRAMIHVEHYPRTAEAIKVAIEFLREVGGISSPSDDDWMDVALDEIATAVEDFMGSFRGGAGGRNKC